MAKKKVLSILQEPIKTGDKKSKRAFLYYSKSKIKSSLSKYNPRTRSHQKLEVK